MSSADITHRQPVSRCLVWAAIKLIITSLSNPEEANEMHSQTLNVSRVALGKSCAL